MNMVRSTRQAMKFYLGESRNLGAELSRRQPGASDVDSARGM